MLTDKTGDILADVNVGEKYLPLIRGSLIRIVVAEVQAAVPGRQKVETSKKLYVDQFSIPTCTADEYMAEEEAVLEEWKVEAAKTVRSKIKCLLVTAKVRAPATKNIEEVYEFACHSFMPKIIDEIVKG